MIAQTKLDLEHTNIENPNVISEKSNSLTENCELNVNELQMNNDSVHTRLIEEGHKEN